MFAVIRTGGKQYRVAEGEFIDVEKLPVEEGGTVEFDNVLFLSNGDNAQVGMPLVGGAKVVGKVLRQGKAKKVIVFKFRKRKNYRRKNGHRQPFTRVQIQSIQAGGAVTRTAPPPPPPSA